MKHPTQNTTMHLHPPPPASTNATGMKVEEVDAKVLGGGGSVVGGIFTSPRQRLGGWRQLEGENTCFKGQNSPPFHLFTSIGNWGGGDPEDLPWPWLSASLRKCGLYQMEDRYDGKNDAGRPHAVWKATIRLH